ncbi:Polyketide cyclase / dehydrase and lipid transport [Corynebacterium ciconiae DSM 44920]|uniref:SRPBCC family protein n=1 Tax=Corynebacterium ciconiae TaxID=227319 RepID=UPI00037A9ACA|nr:SRPBCC family protein [Corynebacterium ciconiae]WKD61725.1 Polyketide cyclase / dehydrase and lipid transport [Corynebacterium ciconiae DSM 44920]
MNLSELRSTQDIYVEATPSELFALVTSIERTGEWSPICRHCWWEDENDKHQKGAWFKGLNETPDRTWKTRSLVTAYEPDRHFEWAVNGEVVTWGFILSPEGEGTRLTETWEVTDKGLDFFKDKYGEDWQAQIAERRDAALEGIPATLEAIKRIAESS